MLPIIRRFVALFALLGATSAFAQSYNYSVYIDADNNAATGCSVSLSGGNVAGVEFVLAVTVNAGSPPQIAQVTRSTCSAGTFGAPVAEGAGAVSVGAGNGGTTAIELGDTLVALGIAPSQTLRLYVAASSAAGSDLLLTTNGDPAGAPILLALAQFAPAVPAPSGGLPTLLVLVAGLLLLGTSAVRHRFVKHALIGLVLVSGGAGAAIFNWGGILQLASDPAGDTTSGETAIDLRYFYGMLSSGNLGFRIDVTGSLATVPPPAVTSIAPNAGPIAGGTSVTINGTDLGGTLSVKFGATNATSYTLNSANSITATAPAGAGTVDVTVTTVGGTSAISAADQYTYVPLPTVTSIAPTSGPTTGGTSVVITGTNFTGASAVQFGASNATSFTVVSATQITATSPAGSGTVDVTVTTVGGTSATGAVDQYTYVPLPTVTSIAPTSGPTAGGTSVTITGTNLSGATSVQFGASNATAFTVVSATQITATSPAGAAGTADVTVTTVGGTSAVSAADQYTYVAAPTVTSIAPTAGPVAGGTAVTITGTNFSGASTVQFGGTNASSFTVVSATQITATSPAGSGTVDVTVTTVGGTSAVSAADQYTYVVAPTAASLLPISGPTAGGTVVTVTGANFSVGASSVTIGGTTIPAASVTVNSSTSLTFSTPAHAAGNVAVSVTTPGGTSGSVPGGFTYLDAPTAPAISPASGPVAGGTSVTVTGTNFSVGASSVTIGGTTIPAGSVIVNSSTSLTFSTPAHAAGNVTVSVTTPGGTSSAVPGGFTYFDVPTATALSPISGPIAGGTSVTVSGTNFVVGSSSVTIGVTVIPAASVTVNSPTSLTFTTPAHAAGNVAVSVTTPGGTSSAVPGGFTYLDAPTATALSPINGPVAGGTSVTVTGANFSVGASSVTIGGTTIPAASVTVNSSTSLTFSTPAHAAGNVTVSVTTPGGTSSTVPGGFTYLGLPTVTAISPTAGPIAGGTSVTITGANLASATSVTFGGVGAMILSNTTTQVVAVAPAHASATVDVAVTTAGGTSATSAADQYTYVAAPTITSISPNTGPTAGGTSVTITGTNLNAASAVQFGATSASSFTPVSATSITATAPAGSVGAVDVSVTAAGGSTTAAAAYTYANPPVASNDSYSTVGNTALYVGIGAPLTPYVSASNLLLANDTGSGGYNIAITQLPAGAISNLNTTTGAFVYTPPAGFTGTDTFKYTITDATALTSAPATVSITVSGRVWYVNGAAATNGNGVSSSPFNTLTGVAANSGDTIFVESTASTSTSGAISLGAGVVLWGQGTALPTISAITIGNTAATSKPVLKGTVTLAGSNSTVSSLDIDTSATAGTIALTNTGSPTGITVQNNVGVTSSGATAVMLNGASGGFTFSRITASSVGAANAGGISLTNVGGTGFTVTGDGSTAGSGGSIGGSCSLNATGCGAVTLSNAGTVSLNWMTLNSPTGSGIYATDTLLTAANSTLANFPVVGIRLGSSAVAAGTFNLHDNTLTGGGGNAIQVQVDSSGTWSGHIKTNTIGNSGTANSGSSGGDGIGIDVNGGGTATVDVSNNKVYQIKNGVGIRATSTAGTLNASVLNNTVSMVQTSGLDGISVGSSSSVCLNVTGNTSAAAGTAAGNSQYDATGLSVLQNTSSSLFSIQGYADPPTNDGAVQSYLATSNTLSGPGGSSFADHTTVGNTNGFGAAVCATAP